MAQVITYRPSSSQVTATQTINNNGKSLLISPITLPEWDRFILFGVAKDIDNNTIPDAGVRVYQLADNSTPMTETNLIATVFADAQGEYGISLATLTDPEVYAVEVFSPGN